MSDLLNSLHDPAPAKSWAQEVADAGAADAAQAAPEPVPSDPAPAETQEAAPEAPQAQEQAPEEHDRRVPLKALQEERQKRAEYERRLVEYERRMAELEQRTRAPEPEQAPEPDPETDPIGALKHAREQLKRIQEETQRQQHEAYLNNVAYNAAVQYQQVAPDYTDAYKYAISSRAQELAVLGVDEQSIPQILRREELSLIDTAVRSGRNPAEAIYQFARARGFNSQPAAPQPAPRPAAPDPVLQQTKQAVAASAAAGGTPASKGDLTDNEIVNLSGAAFDAAWNKKFGGRRSSMFRE